MNTSCPRPNASFVSTSRVWTINAGEKTTIILDVMAAAAAVTSTDFQMDTNYAIMTVNSQIIYKPTDQHNDPEPDNDHEVYVGNLPLHYTIEKFISFAK